LITYVINAVVWYQFVKPLQWKWIIQNFLHPRLEVIFVYGWQHDCQRWLATEVVQQGSLIYLWNSWYKFLQRKGLNCKWLSIIDKVGMIN
jgi:hypothetical protein